MATELPLVASIPIFILAYSLAGYCALKTIELAIRLIREIFRLFR